MHLAWRGPLGVALKGGVGVKGLYAKIKGAIFSRRCIGATQIAVAVVMASLFDLVSYYFKYILLF